MHFGSDSNEAMIGWSFADIRGSFQGNYRGEYDQAWADGTISSNKEGIKCDKPSGLHSMNLVASASKTRPRGSEALTRSESQIGEFDRLWPRGSQHRGSLRARPQVQVNSSRSTRRDREPPSPGHHH
jgi:hypothetical protein